MPRSFANHGLQHGSPIAVGIYPVEWLRECVREPRFGGDAFARKISLYLQRPIPDLFSDIVNVPVFLRSEALLIEIFSVLLIGSEDLAAPVVNLSARNKRGFAEIPGRALAWVHISQIMRRISARIVSVAKIDSRLAQHHSAKPSK
jgi:hypothetical protein